MNESIWRVNEIRTLFPTMKSVGGRRRAAARNESKSIEALLRHGASPNIFDRIGQGPLRKSIKAHDASCTKLLLLLTTGSKLLYKALFTTRISALLYTSLRASIVMKP